MKPKRKRLYMIFGRRRGSGRGCGANTFGVRGQPRLLLQSQRSAGPRDRAGTTGTPGGLVEDGSVQHYGVDVTFRVTDLVNTVPVRFTGILPDLFGEGQGVVTEGTFGDDGTFLASDVLAKHDENYMPKEVADSLKAAGQWKGAEP